MNGLTDSLSTWGNRQLLRAGFAWDHSHDPRLTELRTFLETRLLPFTTVTSAPGAAAPGIGYAGVPHGLVKIHQLLERQRDQGRPTRPPLRGTIDRDAVLTGRQLPPGDLVAVGCTAEQAARLPRRAALVLPYRLHLIVDLPAEPGAWRRNVSRRERQWGEARRHDPEVGLEIATDDASFDWFYDHMHLPTMRERHGERARSEKRVRARECLYRQGMLAFVTFGGERVSGTLCVWDKATSTLTLRLVGVLEGDFSLYDRGALRVADHLLLDWADQHRISHVDFGGTEAWLSQGTFRWKRKFGARAAAAPNHLANLAVWWHARNDTPAVRDFLVANPALERLPGGKLRAVYFEDAHRPARHDLSHSCANVTEARTVHLDAYLADLSADPMQSNTVTPDPAKLDPAKLDPAKGEPTDVRPPGGPTVVR
ncbi:GNAT family N-acetyltransferase [Kitasatospora kifunensis]|uniref:BioF2-like acetyltransferase domain-containing protein n=1 Tax=Kitasatospora kifunensis TaxID=58351 RepID=A0A7W7QZ01_KITKI|nr:GNAT family N-acetyltransferase [Kitasatospora kifunensis]MBB4922431.1 hypothetical protein [Kitasatospora kifunensis]